MKVVSLTLAAFFISMATASFAHGEPGDIAHDFHNSTAAAFYLDFDWGRSVINLTPQDPSSHTLAAGHYSDGFRTTDFYAIGAGAGPSKSFVFRNGPGWRGEFQAYVGLIPFVGKTMRTTRFAATPKAVAAMKRFRSAPMHVSDLKSWALDDEATFATQGGIAFGIGGTQGVGVISATIMSSGEHEISVVKTAASSFLVSISSTKVKSASIAVGASFAALAASKAWSYEHGLSFVVDISTPDGANAYEDLLRGNVATIQGLIDAGQLPQVQRASKFNTRQTAKYVSFSIGVPFFFEWSWSTGKLEKFSDVYSYGDGTDVQTSYGIYVKDHTFKRGDHHHSTAAGFYGVSFNSKGKGDAVTGKFGQFYWAFSSDHSSSGELRSAVRNLLRATGFGSDLVVEVPDEATGTNMVSLAVDITSTQTAAMLANVRHQSKRDFEKIVKAKQDAYFAAGDKMKLCSQGQADDCMDRLSSESESGADEMYEALNDMADAAKADDTSDFTDAYAKFGRGMTHNQFAFQGALQIAGPGSPLDYKVAGTTITNYHVKFETTGKSGALNSVPLDHIVP
jgi:hypothetical protein